MDKKSLETIQNIIGYKFNHEELLVQAFTRESYAYENPGNPHCEVLEFYGDSVLGIVVVKSMCKKFGKIKNKIFVSEKDEGELTQIKSSWVDKKHLSKTTEVLGLEKYIRVGNSEITKDVKKSKSIKEDLCESIIGAVAVDCNWNFEILEKICTGMLDVKEFSENTIRILAQWCKSYGYKFPTYSKVNEKELSEQMDKNKFYQKVNIPELNISFIGCDDTQTEAKMQAAFKAINYCKKIDMQKEVGNAEFNSAINQLIQLAQKNYIERPVFIFNKVSSGFECVCKIENQKDTISVAKSKKEAKQKSSYKMLQKLLDLSTKD